MKIAIWDAGAWGTALAISFAERQQVTLWARDPAQIVLMQATRRNQRYLPDIELPATSQLTDDRELQHCTEAALIIVAAPVSGLRETSQQIAALPETAGVTGCAKASKLAPLLPHQIVTETFPATFPRGALSGPSFAQEVARGLPTALTLASNDDEFSQACRQGVTPFAITDLFQQRCRRCRNRRGDQECVGDRSGHL